MEGAFPTFARLYQTFTVSAIYDMMLRMEFFSFLRGVPKRIYLDHAAATSVRPEVRAAMKPYFSKHFGNPSAVHKEGVVARRAVEDARGSLARTLRVRASDIAFTGNGTESNNLALIGYVKALHNAGREYGDMEIISTKIEHPSILRTLEELVAKGVGVQYVDVDESGRIDEHSLKALLSPKTTLVTFAYANSEIGVVQDANKISRIVKKFAKENSTHVALHLDASQAPLWLPCQLDALGVDMMTLDAGKCYGPKGVGVLVHRKGVALSPIQFGGEQERGLRSGTENTPLIIGCAKAIELAQSDWKSRRETITPLRDFFIEELYSAIPEIVLNGSRKHRIANNVNISIPGLDTEYAVIVLDEKGVACSTQSACSGKGREASPVVLAVTGDAARASSAIRFTFGGGTTEGDICYTVAELKRHVAKMKQTTL